MLTMTLWLLAAAPAADRLAQLEKRLAPRVLPVAVTADDKGQPLSPQETIDLVLAPAAKSSGPGLAELRGLWATPADQRATRRRFQATEPGTGLQVLPGWKAAWGDFRLAAVTVVEDGLTGQLRSLWLLVFRRDGALVDGAVLAATDSEGERSSFKDTTTLEPDGRVTRRRHWAFWCWGGLMDAEQAEDLDQGRYPHPTLPGDSAATGRLRPDGALELGPHAFTAAGGTFVSKQKAKVLFDATGGALRVFLDDGHRYVPLTVDGDAGALGFGLRSGEGRHAVTFDARRESLTLQRPDGGVETFTRKY